MLQIYFHLNSNADTEYYSDRIRKLKTNVRKAYSRRTESEYHENRLKQLNKE